MTVDDRNQLLNQTFLFIAAQPPYNTDKNIVAASLNANNNNSKTQKDHQLKMFNFLRTYVIFFFVSFMSNAVWTCSVFCEAGKIPCGGYGPSCEGFRGCTYPDECNDK